MSLIEEAAYGRREILKNSFKSGIVKYGVGLFDAANAAWLDKNDDFAGGAMEFVKLGRFPCFQDWLVQYRQEQGISLTSNVRPPMVGVRSAVELTVQRCLIDTLKSVKNVKVSEQQRIQSEAEELSEFESMMASGIEAGSWS